MKGVNVATQTATHTQVVKDAMTAYFEQQMQQTAAREAALRQDGESAVEMAMEEATAIAEELEAAKAVMTSQRRRYDATKVALEATKAKLAASEAENAQLRAYVQAQMERRESRRARKREQQRQDLGMLRAAKARREGRLWAAAGIEKSLE